MRIAWRCLLPLILLSVAGTLAAQDHAQPRDKERREPPRTSHPAPRAEQPPPSTAPAPARPPAARPDARDRHPKPDGRAVPRPPAGRVDPDARHRHPRPDPDHAYRERRYRWNDYQYEWWHGRRYPYYFPRRYDGPRWRMLFRGFYVFPHARLPYPDEYGVWFYWPFMDRPLRGCGWYWVPTRRYLDVDPYDGFERWRYSRWRLVYLCFD